MLTGLHDDTIRTDMKPFLQDSKVTDEVLLEKMTAVYTLEMERRNKISTTKVKAIRVSAIGEENDKIESVSKPTKSKHGDANKRNTLMEKVDQGNKAICEAIQSLTTQIASLRQSPSSQQININDKPVRKHRLQFRTSNDRRCQKCQQSNPDEKCSHCYKCGSAEHWASGCRKKNVSASTSKIEVHQPAINLEKADLFSLGVPLTGKQRQAARVVGKRCLVRASLAGVSTTILWDIGSQASTVGADWKEKYLPDVKVKPVNELLEDQSLELSAANGTNIPYRGWIDIEVTLSKDAVAGMSDKPVMVLVLVADHDMERPIIGFNVIE